MDGTIPSTIADSSATSGIRTEDDPSHCTGEPSDKRLILPSGKVIQVISVQHQSTSQRTPHHPRRQATLATQHGKVPRCQLHHSLRQGHHQRLQRQRHHHHSNKRCHLMGMMGHRQQTVANPTGGRSPKPKHRHHHCQPAPN